MSSNSGATHAHALIVVDGKFALQLRDEGIEESPGLWGLFGGALEPGESPAAGLVREIREELELDACNASLLGYYGNSAVYVFDATFQWKRHVLHEGQDAQLFDASVALQAKIAPYVEPAIVDYENLQKLLAKQKENRETRT